MDRMRERFGLRAVRTIRVALMSLPLIVGEARGATIDDGGLSGFGGSAEPAGSHGGPD